MNINISTGCYFFRHPYLSESFFIAYAKKLGVTISPRELLFFCSEGLFAPAFVYNNENLYLKQQIFHLKDLLQSLRLNIDTRMYLASDDEWFEFTHSLRDFYKDIKGILLNLKNEYDKIMNLIFELESELYKYGVTRLEEIYNKEVKENLAKTRNAREDCIVIACSRATGEMLSKSPMLAKEIIVSHRLTVEEVNRMRMFLIGKLSSIDGSKLVVGYLQTVPKIVLRDMKGTPRFISELIYYQYRIDLLLRFLGEKPKSFASLVLNIPEDKAICRICFRRYNKRERGVTCGSKYCVERNKALIRKRLKEMDKLTKR